MPEQARRRPPTKDDAAQTPAGGGEKSAAEPPAKKAGGKPDPRVGQAVPPHWDAVGYDDGAQYRCKDGVIVERTN